MVLQKLTYNFIKYTFLSWYKNRRVPTSYIYVNSLYWVYVHVASWSISICTNILCFMWEGCGRACLMEFEHWGMYRHPFITTLASHSEIWENVHHSQATEWIKENSVNKYNLLIDVYIWITHVAWQCHTPTWMKFVITSIPVYSAMEINWRSQYYVWWI